MTNSKDESEEEVKALRAKIGQSTMENDFLEHGIERIHGFTGPEVKKW